MKTELMELKAQFITELKEIRMSCQERTENNKSIPRTSDLLERTNSTSPPKNTPLPLVNTPRPTLGHDEVALSLHAPTYRDIVHIRNSSHQTKGARMPSTNSGDVRMTANRSVARDLPPESVGISKNYIDDEFIMVENKKRKRKLTNMRGTYSDQCKIQVADPECSIYISRALKTVTEANIEEHIRDMGQKCLSVERLAQHRETSFNSFKVRIHASNLNTFLDANFWPKGLVYRRYKERQFRDVLK